MGLYNSGGASESSGCLFIPCLFCNAEHLVFKDYEISCLQYMNCEHCLLFIKAMMNIAFFMTFLLVFFLVEKIRGSFFILIMRIFLF